MKRTLLTTGVAACLAIGMGFFQSLYALGNLNVNTTNNMNRTDSSQSSSYSSNSNNRFSANRDYSDHNSHNSYDYSSTDYSDRSSTTGSFNDYSDRSSTTGSFNDYSDHSYSDQSIKDSFNTDSHAITAYGDMRNNVIGNFTQSVGGSTTGDINVNGDSNSINNSTSLSTTFGDVSVGKNE